MLFGLRKKKKAEEVEEEKRPRKAEGEKRAKKVKDEGSRWASLVVLVVTVVLALGFWVYGKLVGEFEVPGSSGWGESKGTIIFEKSHKDKADVEAKNTDETDSGGLNGSSAGERGGELVF